jgi:hypothetical protein
VEVEALERLDSERVELVAWKVLVAYSSEETVVGVHQTPPAVPLRLLQPLSLFTEVAAEEDLDPPAVQKEEELEDRVT